MLSFFLIVFFFWGIGLMLSLSSFIFWSTTGKFMLATGSIASVCAYSFIIITNNNIAFPFSSLISVIPGVVIGVLFVMVGRKIKAEEFILVNLVVIEIIKRLEYHLVDLTRGAYGIRLGFNGNSYLVNSEIQYLIILTSFAVLILAGKYLKKNIGLRSQIVGFSTVTAQAIGVNVPAIEIAAGLLTGLLAGLGGVGYALGIGYLHPDDLSIDIGLIALVAAISVLRKSFLIRFISITMVLFVMRELMRLIDVGGAFRFGFYDIFIGLFIIWLAIKISKERLF